MGKHRFKIKYVWSEKRNALEMTNSMKLALIHQLK